MGKNKRQGGRQQGATSTVTLQAMSFRSETNRA
jgi:hypothetical protein